MSETQELVPEDIEAPAADKVKLAKKWRAEIAAAEKGQAKWVERANKVEKIYNDERDSSTGRSRKFNILWSNVETLRPAVYMQTPKAQAVRRYRDRDPVARMGSMLLERCIQTSCELYDFDNQMDQVVRDRLVVGRGQCWAFYDPEITGDGDDEDVEYETVLAEYVPWQDFLHSVARTWSEVRWVGRRFYKTRSELKDWLKEQGLDPNWARKITLDYSNEGEKTEDGLKDERSKATIWEIWDKESRKVLFVAPGSNENAIIGEPKSPPVRYRDFFPCPRPLLATTTAKSLIPTPDYALYQDQAEELNRVTERIGVLQKALKVVGLYAAESTEVANMLKAADNDMIPVKNWAMFAEGGGSKGRVEWFPVEQVAEVLKGLYEIREQAKQTLYEVSGIGDILRGSTDPDETATAQGIKAKWGSLRVRRIQKDTQRFAADVMRLKAEVIAEQFQFRTVLQMAGVDQELLAKYVPMPEAPEMPELPQDAPPEMAQAMQQQLQQQQEIAHQNAIEQFLKQVEQLLRDDTARSFRIDVESDSTLEPDMSEEKQNAIEFLTAMSTFMEKSAPMVMQGPEAAKLVGELMLFAVRRFDKVDSLEQVIEQAVEAASKPRPPQPNPEMMKTEAVIKQGEAKLQLEEKKAQGQLALQDKKVTADIQATQMKTQADLQAKAVESQADLAIQRETASQNMQINEAQGQQAMQLAKQAAASKKAVAEGSPP